MFDFFFFFTLTYAPRVSVFINIQSNRLSFFYMAFKDLHYIIGNHNEMGH